VRNVVLGLRELLRAIRLLLSSWGTGSGTARSWSWTQS